jgi:hypothetical protein
MHLRNPRHEAAAQALALGHPKEEAAVLGGLNPAGTSFKSNARKFCNGASIVRRVREIQIEHGMAAELSCTQLIVEAEEARRLAMRIHQPGAAIAAVTCRAKLAGHWKERAELTGKDGAAAVLEVIWPGMPQAEASQPST